MRAFLFTQATTALPFSKCQMENAVSLLKTWCLEHELPWPEDATRQFSQFIELLLHFQKQTNLTGFSTAESLVSELMIDSVQILRLGTLKGPVADIGTGAGFPALPIKILCPELEMYLVEPRTKRYAFLRQVERELGLKGLSIFKSKIESVDFCQPPATAISKAFAPLPEWLELTRKWLTQGAVTACLVSKHDWDAYRPETHGFSVQKMLCENERIYAIVQTIS